MEQKKSLEERLTSSVFEALLSAGRYITNEFGKTIRVEEKASKDFVTHVDKNAESIILDQLISKFPHSIFYGEESGKFGSGELTFVIDPLDATTNFIHGNPLVDISIAVFKGDELLHGAILCPFFGEMYSAYKGKGAKLINYHVLDFIAGSANGDLPFSVSPLYVSGCKDVESAVVCYNRSHHPPEILEKSKRILSVLVEKSATFRVHGTGGLDYCWLASRRFDAVISPLAEPFHSAGYLIMQEAGAKVTDFEGRPYSIDSKTIVAANPRLHKELLGVLKEL